MRLLPIRPDHGRGRFAQGEAAADRRRYRRHHHEYLPLRYLSAHPRGDPSGRRAGQGLRGGAIMGILTREPHLSRQLSRRGFIFASLSAAGGLMLGIRPGLAATPDAAIPFAAGPDATGAEIGAWIVIDPDESITLRVAKSEMGQGVFTALPMIIAEELACDWRHVRAEYAEASRNLAAKPYGSMGTGGSRSVRGSHEMLQQVGAS